MTDIAMTLSMAEKANAFSAGGNRACPNGRSKKNKCGNGERIEARDRNPKKRPLCNGGGQGKKLLYLWRIQTHSLTL